MKMVLGQLTERSCRECAGICARLARQAASEEVKAMLLHLEENWLVIAKLAGMRATERPVSDLYVEI
jgi:hypothetical protein